MCIIYARSVPLLFSFGKKLVFKKLVVKCVMLWCDGVCVMVGISHLGICQCQYITVHYNFYFVLNMGQKYPYLSKYRFNKLPSKFCVFWAYLHF